MKHNPRLCRRLEGIQLACGRRASPPGLTFLPQISVTGVTMLFRSNTLCTAFASSCGRTAIALAIAALVYALIPLSAHAETEAPLENRAALLPMLSASPPVTAEQTCTLNDDEAMLFEHMRTDPEQARDELNCNPTLSEVARARAKDMAERNYFDHVNPDGYGPNYQVRQAGFELPEWYPDSPSSNNVESIGAHFATAGDVWEAWTNADGHRLHVLGMDPFFAEQVEIGVGYYYDESSHYKAYWVVITAPPEPQ